MKIEWTTCESIDWDDNTEQGFEKGLSIGAAFRLSERGLSSIGVVSKDLKLMADSGVKGARSYLACAIFNERRSLRARHD